MTKKTKIDRTVDRDGARQGDVLIIPTHLRAAGATVPADAGRVVLAYGEVTGHAHAFARSASRRLDLYRTEEGRFVLRVGAGGAVLRHEEHGPIPVPARTYEIVRQREYSPEAIRNVAD